MISAFRHIQKMLCSTALCFAFVAFIVYLVWDYCQSKRRVDELHRKSVFITGCDSGFGHALAVRLDSLGVPVFAGCFTDDGKTGLQQKCSGKLHTVKLDVGSPESIKMAYDYVVSHLPEGIGKYCKSEQELLQFKLYG